jgi:hypothetical protein
MCSTFVNYWLLGPFGIVKCLIQAEAILFSYAVAAWCLHYCITVSWSNCTVRWNILYCMLCKWESNKRRTIGILIIVHYYNSCYCQYTMWLYYLCAAAVFQRHAADQILRELQNNPDMWLQVVHILQNSQNLNTKFFALQVSFDSRCPPLLIQ